MNLKLIAAQERARAEFVNRFLAWKLPDSLRSDTCVTMSDYKHSRSGTNLMTAAEAAQLYDEVVAATWNDALTAAEGVVPHNLVENVENGYQEVRGFNRCRTETLQALATLKV